MIRKKPFNLPNTGRAIEKVAKKFGLKNFNVDWNFYHEQNWILLELEYTYDSREIIGYLRNFEQKKSVSSTTAYAQFAQWLDKKVLYDKAEIFNLNEKTILIECPELR